MLPKKNRIKIEDIPNDEQDLQDLSKDQLLTASIFGGAGGVCRDGTSTVELTCLPSGDGAGCNNDASED